MLLVLAALAFVVVIGGRRVASTAIGLVLLVAIAMMGRMTGADTNASTIAAYRSCLISEARSQSFAIALSPETLGFTSQCAALRQDFVHACEQAGHGDQQCLDDIEWVVSEAKAAAVE
jgi:hypothetical protein